MIEGIIKNISKSSSLYKELSEKKWASIAKPLRSLGYMEENISKLCGIYETLELPQFKSALIVMCGDHGVVCEGVTQTDSSVTAIVAENFEKNKASASIMAKNIGANLFAIDIGMDNEGYENKELIPFRLTDKKIAKGTKNLSKESAMTKEQCLEAISYGIDIIGELKKRGYNIFMAGEMGIGNTTPSSALSSWFLGISPEMATGFGAGLSKEGLERKVRAVKNGITNFEKEDDKSAFSALAALGGLDLAGMTGLFLGAAIHKVPIIIDGFVSSVSALAAVKICPQVSDYIIASHLSKEPCAIAVLKELNKKAVIQGEMCLGEGVGALMLIPLLNMCKDIFSQMSTFEEINIESYKEFKNG